MILASESVGVKQIALPSVHAQSLSHVQLFVTSWTVASQGPLSMAFLRQEILERSGLPFPFLGSSQSRDGTCVSCITSRFLTTEPPGKQLYLKKEFFLNCKTHCLKRL